MVAIPEVRETNIESEFKRDDVQTAGDFKNDDYIHKLNEAHNGRLT